MNLLLRAVLVLAGLVFAASLALVVALMFALWGLRAAWARLTGRPIAPFVVRMHPFGAFDDMVRRNAPASRTPRADAVAPGRPIADVTDVEAKR
ncbi:hypothetical protein [Ramlibacter sp.]|uniref:hypothetical protein n=1 Tax=Ramlibacter sp. TaxID=1917967 RepID=UPI002C73806A|nr:hypothetical protein [Ramlibacter sp.]HWI82009.1 hypothetical protein [Ramlibacter sp.]